VSEDETALNPESAAREAIWEHVKNDLESSTTWTECAYLAQLAVEAWKAHPASEVQRLTAELALKDQALDEIKALVQEMCAQAVMIRAGKTSMKGLRAELREAAANDVERILTRLDTQGETK
jgi:hypothetical protein